MIGYYLSLALRRFRANRLALSTVVLVLGVGVGCTMVMHSIVRQITHDPAPGRSGFLYRPFLDVRPETQRRTGKLASGNLTWPDARQLLESGARWPQVALAGGHVTIRDSAGLPSNIRARYATDGLFKVLGIELAAGRGWSREEGDQAQRVAVMSSDLMQRQCHRSSCLGSTIELDGHTYTVIGVSRPWRPVPMYHADLPEHAFAEQDQIFLPLAAAVADRLIVDGSVSIWGDAGDTPQLGSSMAWLQFWAWLPRPGDVAQYEQMLRGYAQQRGLATGEARVWPLMEWLDQQGLVPSDTRVQLWLSYLLLAICVTNAGTLLYLVFDRRRQEMAIRRALGARRADILRQLLLEAALVGVASGATAVTVYLAGLNFVHSSNVISPSLTVVDPSAVGLALAIGVAASLACAVIPALRLCSRHVAVHQIAASP